MLLLLSSSRNSRASQPIDGSINHCRLMSCSKYIRILCLILKVIHSWSSNPWFRPVGTPSYLRVFTHTSGNQGWWVVALFFIGNFGLWRNTHPPFFVYTIPNLNVKRSIKDFVLTSLVFYRKKLNFPKSVTLTVQNFIKKRRWPYLQSLILLLSISFIFLVKTRIKSSHIHKVQNYSIFSARWSHVTPTQLLGRENKLTEKRNK